MIVNCDVTSVARSKIVGVDPASAVKLSVSPDSDTLVGASVFSIMGAAGADAPEWWVGGLVLAGYAALFLLLGYLTTWRRDVS